MKVAILYFSPTGNTRKVARMIAEELETKKAGVQLLELSKVPGIYNTRQYGEFLQKNVEPHDVLCVGAPVYLHHFPYHARDFLKALPAPGDGWGRWAAPFVTFGEFNSGIALLEAGRLLRASGRVTAAGMKINAWHCMTALEQMRAKINVGMPGDEAKPLVADFADRLLALDGVTPDPSRDITPRLDYQKGVEKFKAHVMFNEWFNHTLIFPDPKFKTEACNGCGLCVKHCPVQRIVLEDEHPLVPKGSSACIHCGNCVVRCPEDAVYLVTAWNVWNFLFDRGLEGKGPLAGNESPKSQVF